MNYKLAVEEYQCSGCMGGGFDECYNKHPETGVGCSKHRAGTFISSIGSIYLGMPKGFNRLGKFSDMTPLILENFEDARFDEWNIPVWKHLDKNGNTLVRGLRPRNNEPYILIFLGDHMDKIDCHEVTQERSDWMD